MQSTWEEAGAKEEVIRAQIFQLSVNLLSDKSHEPWDKIVKAQTEIAPHKDLNREKCMTKREARLGSHFSTT